MEISIQKENLALLSVKPVSLGMSVVPLRDSLCAALQTEKAFCLWYPWSKCPSATQTFSLIDLGAPQTEAANKAGEWAGRNVL